MDRPIQTLSKSYTGSVQGVKVRSAQLDDFEAILDIDRNLYQRLDYLPYNYQNYLKSPLRKSFVAECDNVIIGFAILYIVDDGRSIVAHALRVSPKHQGKGIASLLIDRGIKEVMQTSTDIERLLWCTVNTAAPEKILHWNKDTNLISERYMKLTELSREHLLSSEFTALLTSYKKECQPMGSTYQTSCIPESNINDFLNKLSQEQIHLLLPGNIWILNYDPYSHFKSNFELFHCDMQIALYVTQDSSTGMLYGLSFGTLAKVVSGHKLYVDFYHNASVYEKINIPEMFVSHFIHQVEHIIEHVGKALGEEVSLGGFCYGEESIKKLRSFMDMVNLPPLADECKQCYCFELGL